MCVIDRERTRWFLSNILPHETALRSWLNQRQPFDLEADDIIQESYAILADLDAVDTIRHPRAYLFQVARSVISKHVVRARIVPFHTVGDLAQFDQADVTPSPEQVAIDRDQLRQLAQAIGAMPTRMQEAFILRRVEGLSQREISARMAISENTVEKHISHGLRFLIDWFGDGGKALPNFSCKRQRKVAPLTDERETSRSIDEKAADWIARLDRGPLSEEDTKMLEAWLHGDPRRCGAFLRGGSLALLSEAAQALDLHFNSPQSDADKAPSAQRKTPG